jgi:hypothetical protein
MVSDGRLDAAAIDSQVLAFEQRRRPALRHALRTMESLGPSSIQPVVRPGAVEDADYDDIRAMAALARDAPGLLADCLASASTHSDG